MRVAVIVSSPVVGGHEIQLMELCKSIGQRSEIDFWVSNEAQLGLIGEELNTTRIIIDDRIKFDVGNIFVQFLRGLRNKNCLVDDFRSYNAIIISAGTPEAGISAYYKLKILNNKIYFYFPALIQRTLLWGKVGAFYDLLLRLFIQQLKNIITISNVQSKVFASFATELTHIHVVSNRVRVDISPGLDKETRLLYLGRLDRQKRVDEIIKWADTDANPIEELLIFGDGPTRDDLIRQSSRCKRLKVTFLGWMELNQIGKLISLNDVLVLNSKFEGDPLVIREMQKAGVKVIARDIRGVRGSTNKSQRFSDQKSFLLRLRQHFDGTLKVQKPNFENLSRVRQNQIGALLREFEKMNLSTAENDEHIND